jgi:hypothetical protein
MANGNFISYLRVSTARQGASGLGLEAQRKAVADYLNGGSWNLVTEVVEVESGKRSDRLKLAEALRLCRLHNATLVIAKLDRLSRDAHFLLGLEKAGVDFVAADMPSANRLTVGIMAMVADEERRMISQRTKAALASKKAVYEKLSDEEKAALVAKGKATQLGGDRGNLPQVQRQGSALGVAVRIEKANRRASDIAPILAELRSAGVTSLGALARALAERGIPTARGGTAWSAVQVARVLERTA